MREREISIKSEGDYLYTLRIGEQSFKGLTMEQIIEKLKEETESDNG